jgi:hypothetical protein
MFLFSHLLPREAHSSLAQLKDELNLDPALVERYIELLCLFSPEKVYPFVTSSEGYRLDNAIQVNILYFSILLHSFYT